jgi:hypothetical protein
MSDMNAAPSAGADTISGGIDAVLSVPEPSAEPEALDTPEAETADPVEDAPAEEAPVEQAEEAPAEEAAPVEEPEPELDPADELQPDKTSPDGKFLHFRKNKAQALMAARDFQRRIEEAIPGATVEALQENYSRVAALDEMIGDYRSGDPTRVSRFVGHWFGQSAPASTVKAALGSLAKVLPQSHPEAFAEFERVAIGRAVDTMYQKAMQSGDEKLLRLAQNMDFQQRGKFRTQDELSTRDPLEEERARFEQERSQWAAERRAEQERATAQWMEQADAAVASSVEEEVSKSLEAVKANFKPHELNHIKRDLTDAIEKAKKANPTWLRQYQNLRTQAQGDRSEEAKQALVAMMRQFASNIIARQRKAVIEANTGTVMSQSAAAHQKQQQAAARREPTGGSPAQRASATQQVRAAKTLAESWDLLGFK